MFENQEVKLWKCLVNCHVLGLNHVCWVSDVRRCFKAALCDAVLTESSQNIQLCFRQTLYVHVAVTKTVRISNDSLFMKNLCHGAVSPPLSVWKGKLILLSFLARSCFSFCCFLFLSAILSCCCMSQELSLNSSFRWGLFAGYIQFC